MFNCMSSKEKIEEIKTIQLIIPWIKGGDSNQESNLISLSKNYMQIFGWLENLRLSKSPK